MHVAVEPIVGAVFFSKLQCRGPVEHNEWLRVRRSADRSTLALIPSTPPRCGTCASAEVRLRRTGLVKRTAGDVDVRRLAVALNHGSGA